MTIDDLLETWIGKRVRLRARLGYERFSVYCDNSRSGVIEKITPELVTFRKDDGKTETIGLCSWVTIELV